MRYTSKILTAGALLSLSFGACASQIYTADLGSLNDSGVSGNATLTYDDMANTLEVGINASDLELNQEHAMHIHGRFNDNGQPIDSVNPTLAANDSNGDGVLTLSETAAAYGGVLVPLTNPPGSFTGGFSPASVFPSAPNGQINYDQVFDLGDSSNFTSGNDKSSLFPLNDRVIALHGQTTADGTYSATRPVASGEITASAAAEVPEPGNLGLLLAGMTLIGGITLSRKRRAGRE